MNNLQSNIFYIAKKVDEICKRNNIKYFLIGGSALGAFRHMGFIPWDDDFDIALYPEDYEKLIQLLKIELDLNVFFLESERTKKWPFPYTKVKLNKTLFVENDYISKSHPGIFIDIFRLTFSKKDIFNRLLDFLIGKIITVKALKVRGYKKAVILKKLLINLTNFLFPNFFVDLLFSRLIENQKREDTVVSFLFGNSKFSKSFFEISVLSNPIYYKFENYSFLASPKIENYLLNYFGKKYMILPHKNKQKGHDPIIVRTIEIL